MHLCEGVLCLVSDARRNSHVCDRLDKGVWEKFPTGLWKQNLESREKGFVWKRSSESRLFREPWDSKGKHGAKTLDLQEKSWANIAMKTQVRSLATPNTAMS